MEREPASNIVATLAQLVDDSGPELSGDRLSEALADDHALLGDQRQLLDELLPGRAAVEGDDLVELGGGEVAGVEPRDLLDDLAHARVHALEHERHDGVVVALDLRPALHDRRL